MSFPRQAFSQIEILVVIGLITLLASLVIAVAGPIHHSVLRGRTLSTMQTLQQAMGVLAAERGGYVSPAEHPLAASKEPREPFIRNVAPNSSISTTGMAFSGCQLTDVTSGQSNLLLPDDRYSNVMSPAYFGIERRRMGVIGVPQAEVTAYGAVKHNGVPVDPTNAMNWRKVVGTGQPTDNLAFIQQILRGSAWSELVKSKALRVADGNAAADLMLSGRLWAGTIEDDVGQIYNGRNYLIRGAALYDAWGREILYSVSGSSQVFESAGKDGIFVWKSGIDKVFQTAAAAATPSGDDRDAALDNIQVGNP